VEERGPVSPAAIPFRSNRPTLKARTVPESKTAQRNDRWRPGSVNSSLFSRKRLGPSAPGPTSRVYAKGWETMRRCLASRWTRQSFTAHRNSAGSFDPRRLLGSWAREGSGRGAGQVPSGTTGLKGSPVTRGLPRRAQQLWEFTVRPKPVCVNFANDAARRQFARANPRCRDPAWDLMKRGPAQR